LNSTFLDVSVAEFQLFLLVFVRVVGILAVAPVFGHRAVLSQTKVGLALVLAIVLFAAVPIQVEATTDLLPYVLLVVKELIMGMILGFTALLVFIAVQLAGSMIGVDIGFGVVNIIDPMSAEQISIIGTFKNLIALVTFLLINGHHTILEALAASFEMVPLGGIQFTELLGQGIISMTSEVFVMGIKLAAPITAALFLTSLALGIIARTVPQMNVFIVGFPLKIAIGMGMIAASLPVFQMVLIRFFHQQAGFMSIILQQMHP
jgi:flagellar biosynthetic protein FliR